MRRRQIGCMLLVLVVAYAQTPATSDRYRQLTDQIYFYPQSGEPIEHLETREKARARPAPEMIQALTTELRAMTGSAIQNALASSNPSAKSVEGALLELEGPFALTKAYPRWSNIPFADMRSVHGSPVLLAAFAVMRGGFGIPEILPSLQFYSRANGAWNLVAEAGSDFSGRAFSVAPIPSPSPDNEVWYLAWGRTIGDTGARLKMELFAFDGLGVRTVWSRDGLSGGEASVVSGRIRLEYDDYGITTPERPKGNPFVPPKHVVEILRPTLNGLEQDYSEPPQ